MHIFKEFIENMHKNIRIFQIVKILILMKNHSAPNKKEFTA